MYSWPSSARQRSTPTHGHVMAGKRVLVTPTLFLRLRDRNGSRACLQRLIDVPENIIQRFESDGEPHHFRRDSRGALLVVVAGWMTSVLASPTLARCDRNFTDSMKRTPAAAPPLTPKVRMPPAPRGR